jgi:hypothetical protein
MRTLSYYLWKIEKNLLFWEKCANCRWYNNHGKCDRHLLSACNDNKCMYYSGK